MLLKEFDAIRAASSQNMRDLEEEAAEVAKRLKEQGIDIEADGETGETGTSGDGQEEAGEEGSDRKKEVADEESGGDMKESAPPREETAEGKSDEGKAGKSESTKRGYDKDDDIVARQLREAAENETDPELKEKLWKEYEAYKKNSL
jgi:hypothetical protein